MSKEEVKNLIKEGMDHFVCKDYQNQDVIYFTSGHTLYGIIRTKEGAFKGTGGNHPFRYNTIVYCTPQEAVKFTD